MFYSSSGFQLPLPPPATSQAWTGKKGAGRAASSFRLRLAPLTFPQAPLPPLKGQPPLAPSVWLPPPRSLFSPPDLVTWVRVLKSRARIDCRTSTQPMY